MNWNALKITAQIGPIATIKQALLLLVKFKLKVKNSRYKAKNIPHRIISHIFPSLKIFFKEHLSHRFQKISKMSAFINFQNFNI